MSELAGFNPTGRFTGLAELYAQSRPDYPDTAIDAILSHCALAPGSFMVDVGSGTGISARLFARRGIRVLGIEPNAEMRALAESTALPPECPEPAYQGGTAEATGLPDAVADAVLAAQSFHWFEADKSLREFHRILKPRGWLVLVWNERDESDPFTADYGAAVRAHSDAAAVEIPRGRAGQALLESPLFEDSARRVFPHEQPLDEEGLLGRAFSASYAPRERHQAEAFATALREICRRYQDQGRVVIRYETSLYLARRP
jgi:SAM-dependent methyltransferase